MARAVSAALLTLASGFAANGATAQRPDKNCTFTAPSGDYYDIGPLARDTDYSIDPTGANPRDVSFVWNSCFGVSGRGTHAPPSAASLESLIKWWFLVACLGIKLWISLGDFSDRFAFASPGYGEDCQPGDVACEHANNPSSDYVSLGRLDSVQVPKTTNSVLQTMNCASKTDGLCINDEESCIKTDSKSSSWSPPGLYYK